MWPPWSISPSRVDTTLNPSLFRLSSFKDLQFICQEEPPPSTRNSARTTQKSVHIPSGPDHHIPAPNLDPQQLPRGPTTTTGCITALPIAAAIPGIVVYFTSLRVVRKKFEDCRAVRSLLKGFQVLIDEPDLSMDVRFLDELHRILGQKKVTPPCVFIGGRYIGGAIDIKQMNETGELKKLIQRLQLGVSSAGDECGGHRYVPCDKCNISHKIYVEKFGGFKSCLSCGQNGLIRCPSCSRFPRGI